MPVPFSSDYDRADQHTATASRPVDTDTAEKAAAYVRRTLGDQADDVLRALGLAAVDSKPWRRA